MQNSSTLGITVVYVGQSDDNSVHVYHLTPDGQFDLVQTVVFSGVQGFGSSTPLVLARKAGRLYAGFRGQPRNVLGWAIAPADGTLTPIGTFPLALNPANLSLSADERALFSVSFSEGLVAVNPVSEDGAVLPATQCFACGPKAHAARLSPDGQHLLVTVFGEDRVRSFGWDPATGWLTQDWTERFESAPNAGPRHMLPDAAGERLYVLNQTSGSIDVFRFQDAAPAKAVQTISLVPENFNGTPTAADLQLTSDGRFLYASERSSNTVSAFAVDAASGQLTLLGRWPGEWESRGIAVCPNDRFLLVAGTQAAHLTLYAIQADGSLKHHTRIACGNGPNWIEMLVL